MGETHGKLGVIYKWNGTGSDLVAEACTVSTNDAQITDTAKRILNPNSADLAFTPTNSVNLLSIDYANGTAHYDAAPGVTTCSGTGAYLASGNLTKTGYLYNWTLEIGIDSHDLTAFQDDWKEFGPGLAGASGSCEGFMVGSNWFDDVEDETDGTMQYWFLQLFSYDPDDDKSGDHFDIWATFNALSMSVPVGEYVKETIGFQVYGCPVFTANS